VVEAAWGVAFSGGPIPGTESVKQKAALRSLYVGAGAAEPKTKTKIFPLWGLGLVEMAMYIFGTRNTCMRLGIVVATKERNGEGAGLVWKGPDHCIL
jgi:hypothetical protein